MDALKQMLISVIRTVIMPLAAGGLLQLVILLGVTDPSTELRAALASALALVWYLLARFLEAKNALWGVLLLIAVQPEYGPETADATITSVKRTVVPLLVGYIITVLARAGFELDEGTITVVLQAGITSAYYGILRYIEQLKPAAGVLIGGKVTPPIY
jgi:hypothetical protein